MVQRNHVISDDPNQKIRTESDEHEPGGLAVKMGFQAGKFFPPLPTDRQKQIDCQTLIDGLGKFELHVKHRNQEPRVEKQQERLEKIVGEIIDKLVKHVAFSPHDETHPESGAQHLSMDRDSAR